MSYSRRSFLLTSTAVALTSVYPGMIWAQKNPDTHGDATPKRGGTVTVHLNAEQRILNPALRASADVYLIGAKIMEPLVDLDGDGDPDPMLATSWESSDDGKTITFKLREGVNWHDGKPFTSADVAYTAMEMWKKHLNYSTTLQLYLEEVETPDDHTAVFQYSRPMPMDLLLRALADLGYVAPKHVYEDTNVLENPANNAPIGTGPFKFDSYERGRYVIAVKNPDYWAEDKPYIDKIVWRIITDQAAAAAAVESGDVQLTPYSSLALADMDRLKSDDRLTVSGKGSDANVPMNTIEFNFRREELADHRVREAIVRSMDIEFFCENFLYGFGKPATGPIPSSATNFYSDDTPQYPFDPKKAEALLDEAGYERGKDGKRFKLKLVPAPWGEDITLWSTFMQQSLQDVGIDVEIIRYDASGFLDNVYNKWDFDLATGWHQYRGDPAVSTTVWYRSGSPKGAPWTNQFGWQSDEVDELIDAAAFEIDPEKRRELYVSLSRKINEELPLWMAIEREFISVTSKELHNDHNNPRWPSSHWADLWIDG